MVLERDRKNKNLFSGFRLIYARMYILFIHIRVASLIEGYLVVRGCYYFAGFNICRFISARTFSDGLLFIPYT